MFFLFTFFSQPQTKLKIQASTGAFFMVQPITAPQTEGKIVVPFAPVEPPKSKYES